MIIESNILNKYIRKFNQGGEPARNPLLIFSMRSLSLGRFDDFII